MGLVLKAGESFYGGWKLPWVKACDDDDSRVLCHSYILQPKKDYVPECGDTIDLVAVTVGWDKDRARELRGRSSCCFVGMMFEDIFSSVPPSTLTTFYVEALGNSSQMAANASYVSVPKWLLLHFPAAGYQTPFCHLFYSIIWLDTRTVG